MNNKKINRIPNAYVIMLVLALFCAILTYIIPAGSFDMIEVNGRSIIDPSSFKLVENTPVGIIDFLSAIPKGMIEASSIIFFIMLIGGSFYIIQETGAVEACIGSLAKKFAGKELWLITIIMLAFSFGGAVVGMAEETLVFIPLLISLAIALGFDSITGAAMVCMGASAGFTGSFMNPFTIGVAQGIAGLPLFSGWELRIFAYVAFVSVAIIFVLLYARKIKKEPELSLVYELDKTREDLVIHEMHNFGIREKLIMIVFGITIVVMLYGVVKLGWYFNEMGGLFIGMAIVVTIIAKKSINWFGETLGKGFANIATGALLVGFARMIVVVLNDGQIMDSILHYSAQGLGNLPSQVTASGMYVFQSLLNFLVPSGSGQAAVSMPIMAPLADMVGVTRQTAVLAYQFGDGISNYFSPTSGLLMAGLAMGNIPWTKWAKWVLPLIGMFYIVGLVFVIIAQTISYGPF